MTESATTPVRLVILGRQGSGKGTKCALLVEHYDTIHISTGDMLRAAVEEDTELGREAKKIMDAGELVPDDVMVGIVEERLAKPDVVEHGFLLDGFPRTPTQADALQAMLDQSFIDAAINIDVPVAEVTQRMLSRGRGDDTPEGIARRLELYEEQTAPLIAWFDDHRLMHTVDGIGSELEVFARLMAVIDAARL